MVSLNVPFRACSYNIVEPAGMLAVILRECSVSRCMKAHVYEII
jgi:hypothetical protein